MSPPFVPLKGLSEVEIRQVQREYPTLRRLQEITAVPWQAMAAIWYRESFSVTPPATPGGPWQFDPEPSLGLQRGLLKRFTMLTSGELEAILAKGVNDFFAGGVLAACFLRTKTGPVLHPQVADEIIQDAMYGYNGRAYGSADRSPYVMNGYDADHYGMKLVGTIPDGQGGRRSVSTRDRRPGAYTIYRQLKTLFP